MGMITSDFFAKYGKIESMETSFTVEELIEMASAELQERMADLVAENGDMHYIPAEVLLSLLEDRAFFANIQELVDGGETITFSNVTLACKSEHSSKMGLGTEDVQEKILEFFERADDVANQIDSVLTGSKE